MNIMETIENAIIELTNNTDSIDRTQEIIADPKCYDLAIENDNGNYVVSTPFQRLEDTLERVGVDMLNMMIVFEPISENGAYDCIFGKLGVILVLDVCCDYLTYNEEEKISDLCIVYFKKFMSEIVFETFCNK